MRMDDDALIEWVANAKVGDAVPGGQDQRDIFERLVLMGAPLEYLRDKPVYVVAAAATAWAKERLDESRAVRG